VLTEADWETLVYKISRGQCTPFLGAGVSAPNVPVGSEFARRLAEKFGYPLTDVWNLPRVTQFIVTTHDSQFAKGQVADLIADCERRPPDFSDPGQPHRLLAELRLPLYLTTNYDGFMTLALQTLGVEVTTQICRWNYDTRLLPAALDPAPTPDRPLVYHLHGAATNIASMLVTEDDYVDFLMEAQADLEQVVPPRIQNALTTTSLLFVGYSLSDWNFRVLMRSIMRRLDKSSKRMNISVQLPPDDKSVAPDRREKAEAFLCDYLGTEQVKVEWGDARQFLTELRERWEAARPAAVG
jgi:hypothetical protein